MLVLQVCTTLPALCGAEDGTQVFMHAGMLGKHSTKGATPLVTQACRCFQSLIWGQVHKHCDLQSSW